MILKIKHKGLRAFWENGTAKLINPNWIKRIDRIMNALEEAEKGSDMDFPGFRLHPLRGKYDGYYAVDVSGNWRLVFRFEGGNATDVDLTDYH